DSHSVESDSSRYYHVLSQHSSTFRFKNWNQSTASKDLIFKHAYYVTPSVPDRMESEFEHIDTLRVVNNCDGLINQGAAGLRDILLSTWQTGTSPVFTDTALETSRYLPDTAVRTITLGGLTFNFEQWQNGDTNLLSSDTISPQGDTTVQAYFHANMRADNALYWNNQRKIVLDSLHNRYWFAYVSHGNVYLTRSTDISSMPAGCSWDTARRVNRIQDYGHCTNPSVTWLPYQNDLGNPPRIIVVWEDTAAAGSTVTRIVKYSIYDSLGNVWSGTSNYTLTASPITSPLPCAPMVCPVLPCDSTLRHYGDAVVVWADGQKDSLYIAIINPNGPPGGPAYVPNSYGGQFPAVEPGFNRRDMATLSDIADFELTWHDGTGIKYDYLLLNTLTDGRSSGHIFQYSPPEQVIDTSWTGANAHASLAVATDAEPLIAWEQSGSRIIASNCVPPTGTVCNYNVVLRYGITLRSKPRHDSSWGGFITIAKFKANPTFYGVGACELSESLFAPSVTIYHDEISHFHLYWTHGLSSSCGGDSIKEKYLSLTGGTVIPDTTVSTANGRTPAQPYSQFTPVAEHRTIWAQDTATTEIMKRDNACTVADNYIAVNMNDYNQAYVHWNDTASFSFMSGEYAMKDSAGNVTAVHQQPLSLTASVHSINDAANQMRSQYFHINNNTVKIICYNGVVLTDTTKSLHALDTTRQVMFKVELRDSVTGNLLQTLTQCNITGNFASSANPLGMDTITVTGKSGKTCYIRLTVDTLKAPSTFSVTPGQVYSDNLLSSVVSGDTNGLSKEIEAYRTPISPSTDNPIGLTVFPNPTSGTASILFTIPVEDADYVTQVKVFNLLGEDVSTLVKDVKPAGEHSVQFDGTALPSGRYIVAVHTINHTQSKLMILEK
ncbi:MAG TPA: T9SS type A sorting domain-containing protein, partial [Candidatus Kapabacteria bacterium]|nr:T9SS type A sorting domain-containing protein [Candidatus Kapabacteria bacterium]